MALEQMEGFELAGRTVRESYSSPVLLLRKAFNSFVSIPFTRREQSNMHLRNLSMTLAVNSAQCHSVFMLMICL